MKNVSTPSILIVLIIFGFFFSGPQILGDWESLQLFHNFAPLNYFLDFKISPRGSIGNPGFTFVEISRLIVEKFDLNLNINNIRVSSKIYGILTLFIFFIISKRLFGVLPSFITVIILSTNPTFIIFQNSLTVTIASAFGFLLLIERVQNIDKKNDSWLAWITLSVPLVIIALNYGLVRIYGFLTIIFWLYLIYVKDFKRSLKQFLSSQTLKKFLSSFALLLITLIVLNTENIYNIIKFPTFILPLDSESVILSTIKHEEITLSIFQTLFINIRILFESLLGISSGYHDGNIYNLIIGYRYPILNTGLFLLFIFGFILSIKHIKNNHKNSNNYFFAIFSLALCSIPILSSTIFIDNDTNSFSVSLSNYRLLYLLFPIHFFISLAFYDLLKKNLKFKLLVGVLSVILIFFNIYILIDQKKKFSNNLVLAENKFGLQSPNKFWLKNNDYLSINENFTYHFDQHRNYIKIVKKIKNLTADIDKTEKKIIKINTEFFKFNELKNFHFLNGYDFNIFFLNFYMNDLNLKTGWVQNINKSTNFNKMGFSKNKVFPVAKFDKKLQPINKNKEQLQKNFFLRYHNTLKLPDFIIVKDDQEELYVRNILRKEKLKSKVIEIK